MVVREGFEPSKAEPADLQSAPFGRSGTSPHSFQWCRLSDSNQPPADYKSAALPDELKRQHEYYINFSLICQAIFKDFKISDSPLTTAFLFYPDFFRILFCYCKNHFYSSLPVYFITSLKYCLS